MHSNYRGLAFLLSIGSLPLACGKDDTDTESGDSTSTPATNTANATTTTATGTDTTTGTDATDTTPTTDPTDAATTTTGATDPGMTSVTTSQVTDTGSETGDDTEMLPPATDPTCIAQAAHVVECDPTYARYQNYIAQQCEYYKAYALMKDGQACADAFDAYYVCLSTTECAELMDENACSAQTQAIAAACPSLMDGETDGGSDTGG